MADSSEADNLLKKYKSADSDPLTSSEFHDQVLAFVPDWSKYDATRADATLLKLLEANADALKTKTIIHGDVKVLKAAMNALVVKDAEPSRWILTLLYDMLRDDSSCFSVFDEALKQQIGFKRPLLAAVSQRQPKDQYISDKAAWLLTAIMGNFPGHFSEDDVKEVVSTLTDAEAACSKLGVLDAVVNALKADKFRGVVWGLQGVADTVTSVCPQSATPPYLYKCIFALWMISYEAEGATNFKEELIIEKIRDVLKISRVEKIVRLSLTVLRNLLPHKAFAEHVVELGVLEVVQQLEYEKWRDEELYDDIRDMSLQIANQVQESSNFERYERELKEGKLKWGFIHSSKFWSENVLKFEANDFRALKMMSALLHSTDSTTVAVVCHDLGEFVTMHPLGKKQISKLEVKDRIMELMGSADPVLREVRREALLCCQKIMLNKWQEMEGMTK